MDWTRRSGSKKILDSWTPGTDVWPCLIELEPGVLLGLLAERYAFRRRFERGSSFDSNIPEYISWHKVHDTSTAHLTLSAPMADTPWQDHAAYYKVRWSERSVGVLPVQKLHPLCLAGRVPSQYSDSWPVPQPALQYRLLTTLLVPISSAPFWVSCMLVLLLFAYSDVSSSVR